jgi:hypothetical protein
MHSHLEQAGASVLRVCVCVHLGIKLCVDPPMAVVVVVCVGSPVVVVSVGSPAVVVWVGSSVVRWGFWGGRQAV